jgi:hypothetical protein
MSNIEDNVEAAIEKVAEQAIVNIAQNGLNNGKQLTDSEQLAIHSTIGCIGQWLRSSSIRQRIAVLGCTLLGGGLAAYWTLVGVKTKWTN